MEEQFGWWHSISWLTSVANRTVHGAVEGCQGSGIHVRTDELCAEGIEDFENGRQVQINNETEVRERMPMQRAIRLSPMDHCK